ncbi:hypothetical protein AQUCO_06400059v1 [Aquilegia coerulea]|uniref:ATP synthase subunit alpha, mitochondrial n=1 Tax=Aquilegia coerulea TaxID=218851 RepID=A0A2G5CCI9_AQUCA|nr:hypothetical protein AQUCO_06400059v1 [Aquilegia coerulea]
MATLRADEISNIIRERIEQYNREVKNVNTGTVLQVRDGIARIHGLDEVMAGELVEFEEGTIGITLNLKSNNVGVMLMGDGLIIQEGSSVKATGRIAQIPVSEAYLGRVINALAKPIDGRGEILASESRLIESPAPGIISRRSVYELMQTGLIAIDSMIPIGRGQRELIIGDRQTGKTTVAMDTILNQKSQNVICLYVAIGQKASSVAQVVTTFQEQGVMEYTIVAQAYHQMSFLLRRPPSSAKSSSHLGEGSMTALAIVETQSGDVSAYIPTNVISITDGQIFLSADLFNSGIQPAINRSRLCEFLKQSQADPLTVEEQVVTIYTGINGYLDSLEIGQVKKFLAQLRSYLKSKKPQFQEIISSTKTFTEEAEVLLKEAIQEPERFILQEQT